MLLVHFGRCLVYPSNPGVSNCLTSAHVTLLALLISLVLHDGFSGHSQSRTLGSSTHGPAPNSSTLRSFVRTKALGKIYSDSTDWTKVRDLSMPSKRPHVRDRYVLLATIVSMSKSILYVGFVTLRTEVSVSRETIPTENTYVRVHQVSVLVMLMQFPHSLFTSLLKTSPAHRRQLGATTPGHIAALIGMNDVRAINPGLSYFAP